MGTPTCYYSKMFNFSLLLSHFQVETKRATPREAFGTPEAGLTVKKVFVGGIKEDVDDADIKAYFEEVS